MLKINSPIIKKHFEKYGFTEKFLNQLESPTDEKLQNFDTLLEKLHEAHEAGTKILIYTDFDVDGIMSGVIGYAGLSELGFDCELYKPFPSKGYGIHTDDIDRVLSVHPDCKIILTADVGIGNNEVIKYAESKGLRMFVTDHHVGKQPCCAEVSVDPLAYGETYSHPHICGAHVLWLVLDAYCKTYGKPVKLADIWRLRLFAGIATVSDSMPLLYENRSLVRGAVSIARYYFNYNITNLGIVPPVYSHAYSMAFAGMTRLLKFWESERKIRNAESITEDFFGFYLIPMLNAVKRMDGDMTALYDIFFGQCLEALPDFPDMPCVDNAIRYVYELNNQRKLIVDEKFRDIMTARSNTNNTASDKMMDILMNDADVETLHADYLVKYADYGVFITDAPAGLCGLLAQKLLNVTGLPTLVLYRDPDGGFNGSGRSPSWFNFLDEMNNKGILVANGHNPAFGVHFASEDAIKKYCQCFDDIIKPMAETALDDTFDPYITLSLVPDTDSDFTFSDDLIHEYLRELELLHPLGRMFPAPKFKLVIPANVHGEVFGSMKNHVKLVTSDGTEVIWFNALDAFKALIAKNVDNKPYVATGVLQFNKFSMNDTIDFIADDVEVAI